jgi:LisH domain-containing protein ARMC9
MIKWIATVLRNEGDSLSDYSIEYATALLMNLSLRAGGKDKCEDPNIELLKVLNDLVEHENL